MRAPWQNQGTVGTGAIVSPLELYPKQAQCSFVHFPSNLRGLASACALCLNCGSLFSILNLRYIVQRVHEPTEIVYKSLSVCSLSERGHNFHYTQKGVNNLPKLKYNEIINKFKFLSSGQVPYYKTCGVDLGKRSEALTDNSFLIILKEICYGAWMTTLTSQFKSIRPWDSGTNSFVTPWTVAFQPPLSMGSPRQEYWSGLPCPFPEDFPDPGIEPTSPELAGRFFTTEPPGKSTWLVNFTVYSVLVMARGTTVSKMKSQWWPSWTLQSSRWGRVWGGEGWGGRERERKRERWGVEGEKYFCPE